MSGWWEDEPNGSKAVSLLLRLSALILALASAVMMATADDCAIAGATPPTAVTYRDYGAFVYLVGRSKLLSFGASVSLGLAAVVKDVSLPFNVWPGSSD
uniref:CASP-like protein n=1 Tax=Aegilops tauschii TaxID=37682 RepID=N1QU82_AEGTA